MICSHCKKKASYKDIVLTNNVIVHSNCILELKKIETIHDAEIEDSKKKIALANSKIKDLNRLANRLLKYINQDLRNKQTYWEDVLKSHTSKLKLQKEAREETLLERQIELESFYDYWPSRPPDWERRRSSIVTNSGRECSKCHDDDVELHVHHIVPISQGGSHLGSNLEVLCKFCHYNMHGGKEFSSEYRTKTKSSYEKKLETIKEAIIANKYIHFRYRTFEGEKSTRTIEPRLLKRIGQSQCVEGFCQLRKEDRRFAIKRMSYLKIKE